jgi:hypothetical protein
MISDLPPPRRGSMHSALALGSRVAGKLPQDVACTAVDPDTLARVWVVADGVSECRATPEQVRRFTFEAARAAALSLLKILNRAEDLVASHGVEEGRRVKMLEVFRGRLLDDLSEIVSPVAADAGAACVLGGVLWAPKRNWAMVLAIGNVTSVLLSGAVGGQPGKIMALTGSSDVLFERRSLSEEQIQLEGSWFFCDQLSVAVASDGVAEPGPHRYLFEEYSEDRARAHPSALARLAQAAPSLGHAAAENVIPSEPLDDATVLVGTWSKAERATEQPSPEASSPTSRPDETVRAS